MQEGNERCKGTPKQWSLVDRRPGHPVFGGSDGLTVGLDDLRGLFQL